MKPQMLPQYALESTINEFLAEARDSLSAGNLEPILSRLIRLERTLYERREQFMRASIQSKERLAREVLDVIDKHLPQVQEVIASGRYNS